MISKGLVDDARAAARATVDRLAPIAARGEPIVGLEPSCLLSLRDEYLYLLPGDERARAVAERAVTFEELMAARAGDGAAGAAGVAPRPAKVLLHDHCHQKALVGSEASRRALALVRSRRAGPGCRLLRHGRRLRLRARALRHLAGDGRAPPAAGGAGRRTPTTLIVANGTSCRQQIAHGTGRRALHPAEVLAAALPPPV